MQQQKEINGKKSKKEVIWHPDPTFLVQYSTSAASKFIFSSCEATLEPWALIWVLLLTSLPSVRPVRLKRRPAAECHRGAATMFPWRVYAGGWFTRRRTCQPKHNPRTGAAVAHVGRLFTRQPSEWALPDQTTSGRDPLEDRRAVNQPQGSGKTDSNAALSPSNGPPTISLTRQTNRCFSAGSHCKQQDKQQQQQQDSCQLRKSATDQVFLHFSFNFVPFMWI